MTCPTLFVIIFIMYFLICRAVNSKSFSSLDIDLSLSEGGGDLVPAPILFFKPVMHYVFVRDLWMHEFFFSV